MVRAIWQGIKHGDLSVRSLSPIETCLLNSLCARRSIQSGFENRANWVMMVLVSDVGRDFENRVRLFFSFATFELFPCMASNIWKLIGDIWCGTIKKDFLYKVWNIRNSKRNRHNQLQKPCNHVYQKEKYWQTEEGIRFPWLKGLQNFEIILSPASLFYCTTYKSAYPCT